MKGFLKGFLSFFKALLEGFLSFLKTCLRDPYPFKAAKKCEGVPMMKSLLKHNPKRYILESLRVPKPIKIYVSLTKPFKRPLKRP